MEKRKDIGESIGHIIGDVFGWAFCMAIVLGAYFLGAGAAQYFGAAEHMDAMGTLSAITLIWIYEHRRAEERWTRMFNQRTPLQ